MFHVLFILIKGEKKYKRINMIIIININKAIYNRKKTMINETSLGHQNPILLPHLDLEAGLRV